MNCRFNDPCKLQNKTFQEACGLNKKHLNSNINEFSRCLLYGSTFHFLCVHPCHPHIAMNISRSLEIAVVIYRPHDSIVKPY